MFLAVRLIFLQLIETFILLFEILEVPLEEEKEKYKLKSSKPVLTTCTTGLKERERMVLFSLCPIKHYKSSFSSSDKRKWLPHYYKSPSPFVKKAHLIVDEVDLIFNVMEAHKFSIGKPESLKKDTIDITLALYRFLITSETFRQKLKHPLFDESSGTPFTHAMWHGELKNQVISELLAGNPLIQAQQMNL